MALARGTAAVGYISILGLFLALDMPVLATAPKGFQLDWTAIFSKDAEDFVEAVGSWLLPPAAGGPTPPASVCPAVSATRFCGPADIRAEDLPLVKDVLPTPRMRVQVLNDAVAERLSQVSVSPGKQP